MHRHTRVQIRRQFLRWRQRDRRTRGARQRSKHGMLHRLRWNSQCTCQLCDGAFLKERPALRRADADQREQIQELESSSRSFGVM
jgi:hypothetical protein